MKTKKSPTVNTVSAEKQLTALIATGKRWDRATSDAQWAIAARLLAR